MVLPKLERPTKEYEIKKPDRTYVAVHRNVYEFLRYYAAKKNITVVQAAYEVIRAGLQALGWFK